MGKLQAFQSHTAGKIRQPSQGDAALSQNGIRLLPGLQTGHPLRDVDDQPVQSLVRRQQIGAVADDQRPGAAFFGEAHQQNQLLAAAGEGMRFAGPPTRKEVWRLIGSSQTTFKSGR